MLKNKKFFHISWNEDGHGYANQFEARTIKGDKVVIDHASNLMWQQAGSENYMTYEGAKKWIESLKQNGFAGCKDWRFPTLEEAMSLMEPNMNKNDLYIDPIFDATQRWIWTSDPVSGESLAWVVSFSGLNCYRGTLDSGHYARAVRAVQSSTE